MNKPEIVDLLSLIAARDRRTIGDADVEAWFQDVGDLPYADAAAAVSNYYQNERAWIMPSDVRKRVKVIGDRRYQQAGGDFAVERAMIDKGISDENWGAAKRALVIRIRHGLTTGAELKAIGGSK